MQRNSEESRYNHIVFTWLAIVFLAIVFIAADGKSVLADDELHLTGIIKSINLETGLVYVEVLSSKCQGMRTFRADQIEKLETYVNEKISFFIDSVTCDKDTVHTIVVSRGVRK